MANTKPRPRLHEVEREHHLHLVSHNAPGHHCEYCDDSEPDIQMVQMRLKAYEAQAKKRRLEESQGLETLKFNVVAQELDTTTKKNYRMAVCVVALIALGFAITKLFPSELDNQKAFAAVNGKKFCTADGSLNLTVYGGQAAVDGINLAPSKINVKTWNGGWMQELELLSGGLRNYKWVQANPEILNIDDVAMYADGSPEFSVVHQMHGLKNSVASQFQKNGSYPTLLQEAQPPIYVKDPISRHTEYPEIAKLVGPNLVSQSGSTPFENELRNGQPIAGTRAPRPFEIRCLEVKSEPLLAADLNSYGWKTSAFFIQGFDRNAQPIKNFDGSRVLQMALKNGQDATERPNTKAVASIFQKTQAVCLFTGDAPNEGNIRFKYILILAILAGLIAFICHKQMSATTEDFSPTTTH